MRISEIEVENFRPIEEASMPVEPVTMLVGRNGSGKSALLHALNVFYHPATNLTPEDFYARETDRTIAVQLTWCDLQAYETEEYEYYVDNGQLTVRKEISWVNGKPAERYIAWRLRFPPFQNVRSAESASEKRSLYNELVVTGEIPDLTDRARSAAQADQLMNEWEEQHPELLERLPDERQFFGWGRVGGGKLEHYTQLVLIPAVREAIIDAAEGRDSAITQLIDIIVRNKLRASRELEELRADIDRRYTELIKAEGLTALGDLAGELTSELCRYAPDAAVNLTWDTTEGPEMALPKALVELVEDEWPGDVSRKGRGLQRALIISLLHVLAVTQTPVEETETADKSATEPLVPSLVIAIEEPELYQHPSRQRHFAQVLQELTTPAEIQGPATQVVYSTHSPSFVDLAKSKGVRVARKVRQGDDSDLPPATRVSCPDLDSVAHRLWIASGSPGEPFAEDSLLPRLQTVMTPIINEGFFAEAVVLVEGPSDQAAFQAAAAVKGVDLNARGISVLPVLGKHNLDRPYCIFAAVDIPCYMVFDGDAHQPENANPEWNRRLLSLIGAPASKFPDTQVQAGFACFREELERQVYSDLGEELCEQLFTEARKSYHCQTKYVWTYPQAMQDLFTKAIECGHPPVTLFDIVDRVMAMLGPHERGATLEA